MKTTASRVATNCRYLGIDAHWNPTAFFMAPIEGHSVCIGRQFHRSETHQLPSFVPSDKTARFWKANGKAAFCLGTLCKL